MSKKPKMQLDTSDAGFDEEQLSFELAGEKAKFATTLDVAIYEKLKAISDWDDTTISDVLEEALAKEIRRREEERAEPYEIMPFHRIKSS